MVQIKWRVTCSAQKTIDHLKWKWMQLLLTIRCLTYNQHMSYSYLVDCLYEPIFWFVDNFAKYLGKIFVFCVILLTANIVGIAYWVGLPYWWRRSPLITVFLLVIGNWILLNVLFHYYMGYMTSPGYPPHGSLISEAAGICKKCISPKPPRTHHCSVCDRCILAMDHHCPWLDNCIGLYNVRYFYLYMAYTFAGMVFLIIGGFSIGFEVLLGQSVVPSTENDTDLVGHPVRLNQSGVLVPIKDILEYDSFVFPREHNLPIPEFTGEELIARDPWKRAAVQTVAATVFVVVLALGSLLIMHGKNISLGQTSVEHYINKSAKKALGSSFKNPYNFGRKKNWILFLGLVKGRTFVRHVLLPSRHKPLSNGLTFNTVYEQNDHCL